MNAPENIDIEFVLINTNMTYIYSILTFILFAVLFGGPFYFLWFHNIDVTLLFGSFSHKYVKIVVVLFSLTIIHELIHEVIFAFYSKKGIKSIKLNFLWKQFSQFHCKEPIKKKQFILVKLAPTVVLSIIPAIVALLIGDYWLMALSAFMFSLGSNDFMYILAVRNLDKDVYVFEDSYTSGFYVHKK